VRVTPMSNGTVMLEWAWDGDEYTLEVGAGQIFGYVERAKARAHCPVGEPVIELPPESILSDDKQRVFVSLAILVRCIQEQTTEPILDR